MAEHGNSAPMRGRLQPVRSVVAGVDRLTILENPIASSLLGRLRDRRTDIFEFGAIATQLASFALLEACQDVKLSKREVPGFSGRSIEVDSIAERIAGVAILRAGLVFASPFRNLLPNAPLFQIGIRRDEASLHAVVYSDNLPDSPGWSDRVLVLDPMLATGGSVVAALSHIRRSHKGKIDIVALIAAPIGVTTVLAADEHCRIFTTSLDERLDDHGYIVPGLGDAGDRLFGTIPPVQ